MHSLSLHFMMQSFDKHQRLFDQVNVEMRHRCLDRADQVALKGWLYMQRWNKKEVIFNYTAEAFFPLYFSQKPIKKLYNIAISISTETN